MPQTSYWKYLQLAWFSGPQCDRMIFRYIARHRPANILEIGLGLGIRTLRMFEVAGRYSADSEIRYTGIDLFESRTSESAALPLKKAYKLLRMPGVHVRLIPGEPAMAMKLSAATLARTDLIVIDSDISEASMAATWTMILPVMSKQTVVVRQRVEDGKKVCDELGIEEVRALAECGDKTKRAA